MAKIRWTREAEKWLREIYDHIAQDNPAAAERVVTGIFRKVQVQSGARSPMIEVR